MALRSVTVTLPDDTNLMTLASKVLGVPGVSVNRIIEAAFRAYNGQPREEIARSITRHGEAKSLDGGGRKNAKIDEQLVTGIENIGLAGRIGLVMLMYPDLTRQEAEELEVMRRVKRGGVRPGAGRPRKSQA